MHSTRQKRRSSNYRWSDVRGATKPAFREGLGDADLQLGDFVVVVLFGGEVETGHGGAPVCVRVAWPIATVSTHIAKKKTRTERAHVLKE